MSDIQKDKPEDDLTDLDNRLKALRREVSPDEDKEAPPRSSLGRMMYLAFYVTSELVGSVLAGLATGFLLDWWLKTKPVFLIIFLIIGCVVGVLNVVRSMLKHLKSQIVPKKHKVKR